MTRRACASFPKASHYRAGGADPRPPERRRRETTARPVSSRRYVKEVGRQYVGGFDVTLVYRRDRFGRGGDHIPFLRQGYPPCGSPSPTRTFRDNIKTSPRATASLTATCSSSSTSTTSPASHASTPRRWRRSRPRPPARGAPSSTSSRRTTRPFTGARTTSQTWRDTPCSCARRRRRPGSGAFDAGNVTSTTIRAVNKDDWLFAVEAYDRAGPPQPARRGAARAGARRRRCRRSARHRNRRIMRSPIIRPPAKRRAESSADTSRCGGVFALACQIDATATRRSARSVL